VKNEERVPTPPDIEPEMESLVKEVKRLESENAALRRELWRRKRAPSAITGYTLSILGAVAIASSILYTSSILAFIGLGLVFWGALLLYIRPTRYVKASLLDSSVAASLKAVDRIVAELNYEGKAVYLPPRFLREIKGGTAFIPSEGIAVPPTAEVAEGKVILQNPNGICLTPPGLNLTNHFENELGIDFTRVDLGYLQNNLPKLFIEALEIAEDLELNVEGGIVHARITGSIYRDLCMELRGLTNICGSLGCPLCSSLALAITRAAGKPVIMEKTKLSTDGKTIEADFRILEE